MIDAKLDTHASLTHTVSPQEFLLRSVYTLISHPVFLSALFSWLIAQLIKSVISAMRHPQRDPGSVLATIFWRTGGMPSSHSSMVTALATSIGFYEGIGSPVFILSLCYGTVVIRDALGVRRAAGLQAQALNRLGNQVASQGEIAFTPVREIHGHTSAEVSVGILLGFFIAIAFSIL